jgi:hypothetical protein
LTTINSAQRHLDDASTEFALPIKVVRPQMELVEVHAGLLPGVVALIVGVGRLKRAPMLLSLPSQGSSW